jgi:Na+/H+ antiporter NhaD/arsenite permease-like protein
MWWLTVGLFTLTYIALAIGRLPGLRVDRAGIAFIGATLMLLTGVITINEAAGPQSIDYETLFLLFGMMVVVGFLRIPGFFIRLAHGSLSWIRTPSALLAVIIVLSGILSAFLVNDIVCLALTPLVIHLTRRMKFDPIPHLIALATAANIGSTGTITGNPQNMIIGVQSHIPYLRFALHLMPVAMLGLIVDFCVIAVVYRKALKGGAGVRPGAGERNFQVGEGEHEVRPYSARPKPLPVADRIPRGRVYNRLLIKSVIVASIAVILFFAGFPIALVAIGAASVLMLSRIKPGRIYHEVDWSLLLMFIGLFIVVHAFQLRVINGWHVARWQLLREHPVDLLSAASALLSNLVSNVPAVLLFGPVMRALPPASQQSGWLALAMSSTLAGNFTILGSVANLIVVENARREGVRISFGEYCKAGIPVTLLTLGVGVAWLMFVRY